MSELSLIKKGGSGGIELPEASVFVSDGYNNQVKNLAPSETIQSAGVTHTFTHPAAILVVAGSTPSPNTTYGMNGNVVYLKEYNTPVTFKYTTYGNTYSLQAQIIQYNSYGNLFTAVEVKNIGADTALYVGASSVIFENS